MNPKKTNKSKLTVAEKAYYKYLERGGEHGRDLDDWLAAEQEEKGAKAPAKKKVPVKPRAKKSK